MKEQNEIDPALFSTGRIFLKRVIMGQNIKLNAIRPMEPCNVFIYFLE